MNENRIKLSSEGIKEARELAAINSKIEKLNARKREIVDEFRKFACEKNAELVDDSGKIQVLVIRSIVNALDTKKLAEELPDVFEEYSAGSVRVSVKLAKA